MLASRPVSCSIRLIEPIFFVRWASPSMTDIAQVKSRLVQAHEQGGHDLVYVAIVPEDSTPPDEAVRKAFMNAMDEVLTYCQTMHFVMEGQGFKHSILRNALASVLLVRGQRTKVFVHRTLEEALTMANKRFPSDLQFDVALVARKAVESGVGSRPPKQKHV